MDEQTDGDMNMGVNTNKIPNELTHRQILRRIRPTEKLPERSLSHTSEPQCGNSKADGRETTKTNLHFLQLSLADHTPLSLRPLFSRAA